MFSRNIKSVLNGAVNSHGSNCSSVSVCLYQSCPDQNILQHDDWSCCPGQVHKGRYLLIKDDLSAILVNHGTIRSDNMALIVS